MNDPSALYSEPLDTPVGTVYPVFRNGVLLAIHFSRPREIRTAAVPVLFRQELAAWFHGKLEHFTQEISLEGGTDFQRRVWGALSSIPRGEVRTYAWVARLAGSPRGVRAVGQALGRNPLPLVIPCHRIIKSSGELGGYTPEVEIKRRLLALEGFYLSA